MTQAHSVFVLLVSARVFSTLFHFLPRTSETDWELEGASVNSRPSINRDKAQPGLAAAGAATETGPTDKTALRGARDHHLILGGINVTSRIFTRKTGQIWGKKHANLSLSLAAAASGWRQSAVNYVSLWPCIATSDLGRHANVLAEVLEVCLIKDVIKKESHLGLHAAK